MRDTSAIVPDDVAVAVVAGAGAAPNDAADAAVAGALARSTYGVTGAGETIGIISDSFDSKGQAAANAAAGYLPNVTVLGDQAGTDEGQAMAELAYETAPGAHYDFDTFGTSVSSYAAAVTALQQAGCTIIVDDVGIPQEPFFQSGDALENAIDRFVAAGGDYFTAAGNDGTTYYQATFNGIATVLPGTTTRVTAENFGGGNTLEGFHHVNSGPLDIDLQWETPFRSIGTGGPNGHGAQDSLAIYVYDSGNHLVASSAANLVGGDPVQFVAVANLAAGDYNVAVTLNGGAAPGVFRYEFVENTNDDTISDPNADTGGGNLLGHIALPAVNTVGAAGVFDTPSQGAASPTVEPYSSIGPGELLLDANGNVLAAPVTTGKVDFTAPDGSTTSVAGFTTFYGTSAAAPVAAAVAALVLQAAPNLTPAAVSAALAASAVGMGGGANVGAGLIQAPGAIAAAEGAACYVRGTMLLTDGGERAVEALRIGDKMVCGSGVLRPVVWIGRRAYSGRFMRRNREAWPIRIAAGALADGAPRRDLHVSPRHAMLLDGMLVPAVSLVNGETIVQQDWVAEVEYFHVELDCHDVMLAEGAWSESYLDDDNRMLFANAGEYSGRYPDNPRRNMTYCAPRVVDGTRLELLRRRLAARCRRVGAVA